MIRPRITIPDILTERGAKKRIEAAAKAAAVHAVEFWHRVYMPGHFTVAGGKKYGYQPRKGDNEPPRVPRADGRPGTRANRSYSWEKRRRFRHNKPLVWTGQSERMARQQVRLSVVKRRTGAITAAAAMVVPEYFYRYRIDLKQPNKADELTRVTPDEVAVLTRVYERQMLRVLNRP